MGERVKAVLAECRVVPRQFQHGFGLTFCTVHHRDHTDEPGRLQIETEVFLRATGNTIPLSPPIDSGQNCSEQGNPDFCDLQKNRGELKEEERAMF